MNVTYNQKGAVALITMDRPEALNALNTQMLRELSDAVTRAHNDESVSVLLISGAGKAFVAGADIAQMKDFTPDQAREFALYADELFYNIENGAKPVVAAVNGYALGGGMELALACDIRLAGAKAKFGQPEVGLGITPGFGGTQRLPRAVGMSMAKELIFTARTIDAEEALRIGLVSRVVPNEELLETALALCDEIASKAQIAVRQSKEAINKGMQCDMKTALAFEAQTFALCFSTEDQKNAMNAFVEKKKDYKFFNR